MSCCPRCQSYEQTLIGMNSSGWVWCCDQCHHQYVLSDRAVEQGGRL